MPYASPAQQRFAHAAKARGEPWAESFTEHGDAYMRDAKRKGAKHGPYSKHRSVAKMYQPRYGNAGTRGRRIDAELEEFTKTRFFDPEHRRQRRLGAAQLALGAGGVAGLAFGVKGARKATKVLDIGGLPRSKDLKGAVVMTRRQQAMLAGGTAGVGGAVGVNRYAESRRGRAWT